MTMAAAGLSAGAAKAGAGHAASQVIPQGKSNAEQQILLLLILAAVVIFIQTDKSGKQQSGTQYAALGVVGFILLVIAQFWAGFALGMTVLFVVSIILNSPDGIPVIGGSKGSATELPTAASGASPTQQGAGEAPGINAEGGSTSGTGVQGPVAR
jgi:hypothetical protein